MYSGKTSFVGFVDLKCFMFLDKICKIILKVDWSSIRFTRFFQLLVVAG